MTKIASGPDELAPFIQDLVILLPDASWVNDDASYYIYEFVSEAWTLLLNINNMDKDKFMNNLNNLEQLYGALLQDLDEDSLYVCKAILDKLKFFSENSKYMNPDLLSRLYESMDDITYIDIYYRSGLLTGRLKKNKDMGEHGAFGASGTIDIQNIVSLFLHGREKVLDLGSGNAKALVLFSHKAANVTGVEIDEGLCKEGQHCIADLLKAERIDKNKIMLKHGDFFEEDFSQYDIIYIYWPFDNRKKDISEEKVRNQLEAKLLKEMKLKALFIVCLPGMDYRDLFPKLRKIDIDSKVATMPLLVYAHPLAGIELNEATVVRHKGNI